MLAKHFKKKRNVGPNKNTIKIEKEENKSYIKVEKPTNKMKRSKQKKRKGLIIRNLSFKVDEKELRNVFSQFGNIIDVKIPLKPDGNKKGFGFIEYDNTKSLIQAMKSMNYQEIKGRKVAVDFAVDKTSYQLKLQNLKQENKNSPSIKIEKDAEIDTSEIKSETGSDNETEEDEQEEKDEDEKRLDAFLKEFDSGAEALTDSKSRNDNEDSFSSDESDSESDDDGDMPVNKKYKRKFEETEESPSKKVKKDSHDVSEGKTVFLRNLSFETSQESLNEAMKHYGECVYCLLCMDQYTDHPKGTAFVKFKEKNSADKLVEESFKEPGILLDGRKINCSYAISRDEISQLKEKDKKPKDKRNLNLLRVGLIMSNSKESEDVSSSDMAKRAQLEMIKKQKLRNVNFFVSDKRLVIHNLPKTFSDAELRKLFKKASGKGAIITEARVMKEFSKTDAQGNPVSKGFGFISFAKHEDALKALNELNNNPNIFTPLKRPIVEFSIENKVALLSKERKKEKIQMRNKRRTEEKRERQLQQQNETTESSQNETPSKKKSQRKKKNKAKEKSIAKNNVQKNELCVNKQVAENKTNSLKDYQKKKRPTRKERKEAKNKSNQTDMSNLINKYKDKLLNKIT